MSLSLISAAVLSANYDRLIMTGKLILFDKLFFCAKHKGREAEEDILS